MTDHLRVVGTEPAELGDSLRIPPHSYEAERALLGAILLNNNAYNAVAEFLRAEHFADPANARVYEACQSLLEQNTPANPVTLRPYLETDDLVVSAGGMRYLAALAAGAVTTVNAVHYGRLICQLWMRRRLIDIATDAVNHAYEPQPEEDGADVVNKYVEQMSTISTGDSSHTIEGGAAMRDEIERWRRADAGEIMGLSTGIPAMDRAAGLLHDADLIVLAGRPSMGKTTLAMQIALNTLRIYKAMAEMTKTKPKKVIIFSLEMSRQQLSSKFISMMTGLEMPENRSTILLEGEWQKIIEAEKEFSSLPIIIDDKSGSTPSYIRAKCRQYQRQGGVGLIIVDHLQHMASDQKHDNRTQEVSYLTQRCKAIAKDVKCPFILLSQLNRELEKREDKRPQLSDLRESGTIEQDADVVMFVYREAYYLERSVPKQKIDEDGDKFSARLGAYSAKLEAVEGQCEINCAKRRMGPAGKTAILEFDAKAGTFTDDSGQTKPFINNNAIGGGWDDLPLGG